MFLWLKVYLRDFKWVVMEKKIKEVVERFVRMGEDFLNKDIFVVFKDLFIWSEVISFLVNGVFKVC